MVKENTFESINLISNIQNSNIDNMDKIGKNRVISDQFYTKHDVSSKCIKLFLEKMVLLQETLELKKAKNMD